MNLVTLSDFDMARGSKAAGERLNGWKSIAAHFGRDRSTVIRWSRERGLPVHRLPGGRVGTVYALRGELDCWAGMPGADVLLGITSESPVLEIAAEMETAPPVMPIGAASAFLRHWPIAAGIALLIIALLVVAAFRATPLSAALPTDLAVANDFLVARDLVAERDAVGLERAITLLEHVVQRDPDYAPGHANLAEALLLSREFGMRTNADAFARARRAVRAALRLAPDLAAGHRLRGFIAYWSDHDFTEADDAFRRALDRAPDDALTHFWYGNILSDHGDHVPALRELDRARLMQPGSVAIQTDQAWAQWAAGKEQTAMMTLHDIVRRYPDFAVAHQCLFMIAMMRGDMEGYVHHFDRFARARGEPQLNAKAASLRMAQPRGVAALRAEALRQAVEEADADPTVGYGWAAAVASVTADRQSLITLLRNARSKGEQWGNAGITARVRWRWHDDREIIPLIDSVTGV